MISFRDLEEFERNIYNESLWELQGKSSYEARTKSLQDQLSRWTPELASRVRQLEQRFRTDLETARRSGWISDRSYGRWMGRLEDSSIQHWKKEAFLTKEFPAYFRNWQKLGKETEKLEKECKELGLTEKDLPELAAIKKDAFKDTHYEYKRDLINKLLGAVAAMKKDQKKLGSKEMQELYKEAEGQLDHAVKIGALASWKKGTWLRRIFESESDTSNIRQFLRGGGSTSLRDLIARWRGVSEEFMEIEQKRKEMGTPMSFHFVHMDVFLGWHFEKRKAYVAEANNRFADIDKEPQEFLRIRHALDAKDWADADTLIAQAQRKPWSAEQREKLKSMEKFLREHRTDQGEAAEKQNPPPEEIVAELRNLVSQLPHELQELYRETMRRGYDAFWTLTTLMYNRVWCWEHRHLDYDKEEAFRQSSKQETYDHMRFGHGRRYVRNNLTTDTATEPAVRTDRDVSAPQLLEIGKGSEYVLPELCKENAKNWNFWYWSTAIPPRDVSYGEHEYIVRDIHPRMKRLMRMLGTLGLQFTGSGPIEKKARGSAYEQGMKAHPN